MRKRIALVVALIMILSLVPLTAFAASTNTVDRVPTVSDDYTFTTDAPLLLIEPRAGTEFDGEVFRLNLTNAEFTDDFWDLDGVSRRTASSATVTDATYFEATFDGETGFEIPMLTEIQGEGEARVTIDPLSSRLSGGTLTFAIGATGETVAFVDTVETVRRGQNQRAGTIIIDETTAGALGVGEHGFRLRLPKDFSWAEDTVIGQDFLFLDGDFEVEMEGNSGRDLEVTFTIDEESDTRGSIVIETWINVARGASFGDVDVSLTGEGDVSSQSGLIIADYVDFGVDIEIEEDGEMEFFTGRWDEDYTVEVTLEETIEGSFLSAREIDFDVPEWVWITDVTVEGGNTERLDFDEEAGDNKFFYDVESGDEELTFTIQFTLEGPAAAEGPVDIPLTIEGAGVPATEVVLGIAKPAVMVEVGEQTADLQIGTQRQSAPEIVITETEAAAIREGDLVVFMKDYFADSMRVDSFSWEVVEGDIEIDDDSTAGGNLTLEVGAESEEASVIRLYNIMVTLDRTVPMGPFRADIGGSSLVDNTTGDFEDRADDYEMIETGFVGRVLRFTYVTVGLEMEVVPGEAQVAFTIGQSAYTVDGELMMMDVAPFIMNDRTMIPVRYLEELFGMQPVWNPTSRTVTVMYDGKVFEMAIGSNVLRVNGAPYMEMDAEAMIVEDRTFVPASRFARAMGIEYVWDASTQTATFN